MPIGDVVVRVLATPFVDAVGHLGIRIPRMNERFSASIAFMLFS